MIDSMRARLRRSIVREWHEDVAHVLAQLGDEPQSLTEEEALSERGRDVAFVAKKLTKEPADQARNRLAVVEIAHCLTPMYTAPQTGERSGLAARD